MNNEPISNIKHKGHNPYLSIVVPVYKVEPYIEKCARSIFDQTLDNLEIIFVNDCSPDNSVDIIKQLLEHYPNRKTQTRILTMPKNSGSACVRKKGILESTGDYIIHCDGDDWVDLSLYKTLYKAAIKYDADIVVCDEVMEYNGYSIPKPSGNVPSSGKDLLRNWYKYTIGLFCHNKLVRRQLYFENNIFPWDGLNMWEDNGLFARLFYYANKVVQIKGGPLYHYNRANVSAMTAGYGIKQVEQMIAIANNLCEFFESLPDGSEFRKTADAFKYLARINLITDSYLRYKRFINTFPESKYISKELDREAFSKKGRFRFDMVRFGLAPLFILMFKFKNLFCK